MSVGGTRYFGLHSSKVVCYFSLQLSAAYVAGAIAATGYIQAVLDNSGTLYKVLVST